MPDPRRVAVVSRPRGTVGSRTCSIGISGLSPFSKVVIYDFKLHCRPPPPSSATHAGGAEDATISHGFVCVTTPQSPSQVSD